jgi:hypothetical protein
MNTPKLKKLRPQMEPPHQHCAPGGFPRTAACQRGERTAMDMESNELSGVLPKAKLCQYFTRTSHQGLLQTWQPGEVAAFCSSSGHECVIGEMVNPDKLGYPHLL